MKHSQLSFRIIAALLVVWLAIPPLNAATTTWNAAGGNWSANANWDTLLAPEPPDDVRLMNIGTGTPNVVDTARTVNSLLYGQDNQETHTTTIDAGEILSVNRGNAGDVLYVGSTSAAITSGTLTPVTIEGTGTLSLSGSGDLVVRQGHSTAGAHRATLDLSNLDNFNAAIGRLLVGQATAGAAVNRPTGTLILARTNHITLSGGSPQVMVQDSGSNANGGTASVLTFGQETILNGDVMRLGGQKGNANLNFNAAFTAPSLKIRNADGESRSSIIDFGYNGAANSGNNTVCIADFSAGTIDIAADLINIAIGNPGPSSGTCSGTLTFGAGIVDANTMEIGFGIATGANGGVTAVVNVDNNFVFPQAARLVVNNTLRLARTNGGTGAVNGTLNINGGVAAANAIVAGGGNSVINVNPGGTLVVSNTAGSLTTPIRTMSVSDATLELPASNGGAAVAVQNFNAGGSQNVINVLAVPPIASYPATFTLIAYQSGVSGNFVLGTLPAASPAYSGVLLDAGNGLVTLQLNSGPVVDLSMRWTGAADATWDSATPNWLYQGSASAFFAGAAVTFNDLGLQPDVVLAEALSPGSINVSNISTTYTFTGPGNIAAAGSLMKRGSGTLVLANQGVDHFGVVSILAGTLQLGLGDVDGGLSALSITNNSSLIINRSGNLALSSAITGTGTLTKNGSGTLVLSGANDYSGATVVNGGTLQLDQSTAGGGSVTAATGTVLSGSGVVNGLTTVAGELAPGNANARGSFKAHGGLVLQSGATATFDLSASNPSDPAANDSVDVVGNLTANNNVIRVNFNGAPANGASYLLFTYTGTRSGSFNPVVTGTHIPVALDYSNPGSVYLNVTGDGGTVLKWNSQAGGTWDVLTANWLNLGNNQASAFFAGDAVLFDDTPGVNTVISIAEGLSVAPVAITNDSAANFFTIGGPGRISGATAIFKQNTSTLSLGGANNFTGLVEIEGGVLRTETDTALGTAAGGTTVHDGATLDLNGRNLGGEVITVSGAGADGQGALVNNSTAQAQAVRQVILAGDTVFGGSGLWAINNGGGAAALSTAGNPYKLTKTGASQINLAQTAIDPALGDIEVLQGTLEFSGLTSTMGDSSKTLTVMDGATLAFANGAVVWNKQFVLNGNGINNTVNNGTGANTTLDGPVEVHGTALFNVGGTALAVSGNITGDGGITKAGNSPMILFGENTFTGETRVNSGALRLNGTAALTTSPVVTLAAGATLTLTGRVDSTFTVANGQVLRGNGVLNGHVVANAGSMVSPGLDGIGALTISNSVTLSGAVEMDLDEASGTNDVLRSNTTITYGGTLNLIVPGTLASGSSFKLFDAASYSGSFSSITPAIPGPGLVWVTSNLAVSGTLAVGSSALPQISGTFLQGGSLVFNGSNGVPSGTYHVLASTNLATPRADWIRMATNTFSANGTFSFTNSLSPQMPRRFFLIELP
ncbi:MAG TPA: autotransporter-associated beta strand repeat-containing protein [Verrucomicrobiae bacterium]|nr:autotransporter-associated beta strand repeat-containing protein [Verrucomicrobiae bacterium]